MLALELGARVIGINSRDLETLEVDADVPRRLLPMVPRGVIAVARVASSARAMWWLARSGVRTPSSSARRSPRRAIRSRRSARSRRCRGVRVRVDVKVCGLTRASDARAAAELGARYVGVIFAGGPRTLDPEAARLVLDGGGASVERVGVFGEARREDDRRRRCARRSSTSSSSTPIPARSDVRAIRQASGARVWAVVRVDGALDAAELHELWRSADALVLDSKVKGSARRHRRTPFDWREAGRATRLARDGSSWRGDSPRRTSASAIEALAPDIVDVSSGVESSPGIKDHARIRRLHAKQCGEPEYFE